VSASFHNSQQEITIIGNSGREFNNSREFPPGISDVADSREFPNGNSRWPCPLLVQCHCPLVESWLRCCSSGVVYASLSMKLFVFGRWRHSSAVDVSVCVINLLRIYVNIYGHHISTKTLLMGNCVIFIKWDCLPMCNTYEELTSIRQ